MEAILASNSAVTCRSRLEVWLLPCLTALECGNSTSTSGRASVQAHPAISEVRKGMNLDFRRV